MDIIAAAAAAAAAAVKADISRQPPAAITASKSWLLYYPAYQALICKAHGYAIADLESHLQREHSDLDRPAYRALLEHYRGRDLAGPSWQRPGTRSQLPPPREPIAPVAGLPIRRGFGCRRCPGFLTISWKQCKRHCSQAHEARDSRARDGLWVDAEVQTFFTRPQQKQLYFRVSATAAAAAEGAAEEAAAIAAAEAAATGYDGETEGQRQRAQLAAGIQQQWDYEREEQLEIRLQMVQGSPGKHEITNWLRRTGWIDHFCGRNLSYIYAASRMPQPEDEPGLELLVKALDSIFFRGCVAGLQEMPLIGRLFLASPYPEDPHSRPFGPLQEKASMDRYLGYSKRFLCYCMRVLPLGADDLVEQHAFSFTPAQRGRLEALWSRLQRAAAAAEKETSSSSGGGSSWGEEGEEEEEEELDSSSSSSSSSSRLEGEVLQVLASFWMQRLPSDPFASPLWHFVAVLGINGETGQLRPAHHFTSILAGLIYTARAVVAEAALPSQDRAAMADLPERLAAIRKAWLCKSSYAPMGYVLNLLLYGKKIAFETGSRLAVVWNRDGTLLYFQGRPLAMETIRRLIASMTADAEDLLWDGLLFRPRKAEAGSSGSGGSGSGPGPRGPGLLEREDRFLVPLATIRDDLTQTQRGQSFLYTNSLLGKEKEMLQNLIAGPLKKQFLNSENEWKWPRVQQYLRQVKRFQELLLLLVHLTNHPLRGPEITGLRLVNGINRDRSLFIIDGEVVLVSQYHKSLAHFDSPKVIPRMLPGRVGQLMVIYMLYIRPFTDRLQGSRWALYDKVYLPSDFIWHQPESPSTPWDSSQLSRALAKLRDSPALAEGDER